MKAGKVIGRVVFGKYDPAFAGKRWIIVSPLKKQQFSNDDDKNEISPLNLVMCDTLGSSIGDIIGYVEGAEATAAFKGPTPVDALVVAIIEDIYYKS